MVSPTVKITYRGRSNNTGRCASEHMAIQSRETSTVASKKGGGQEWDPPPPPLKVRMDGQDLTQMRTHIHYFSYHERCDMKVTR